MLNPHPLYSHQGQNISINSYWITNKIDLCGWDLGWWDSFSVCKANKWKIRTTRSLSMVLIPTCLPFSWQYSTSALAADSHVSPDCSCSPLLAVDVGLHQECTCHGAAACCLYDLYFTWLPSIGCTILWNRLKVAMADLDVDCLLSTLWRNLKENSHIDPNSCLFFLLYRSSWSWPLHFISYFRLLQNRWGWCVLRSNSCYFYENLAHLKNWIMPKLLTVFKTNAVSFCLWRPYKSINIPV